jgi:DNA-binding NarL/FixJ family response regulator
MHHSITSAHQDVKHRDALPGARSPAKVAFASSPAHIRTWSRRRDGAPSPSVVHHRHVVDQPLRVVIAEDSGLIREALARLIGESGGVVVAKVGDGPSLVAAIEEHRPDVSVVDVRMPPSQRDEGLRAAIEARRRVPGTPVLVLSQYVERQYATELLADRAGGVGYLLKDRVADIREFMDALRRVARGGTALDPEVVAQLMVSRRADDPLAALTPREREVLAAMAEGRTNHGIAELLHITEGATEKHITNIFGKLELPESPNDHRRVLAVLAYLEG